MIEFKKLRKVYNSRGGGRCVALNDIDLKLPDKGLVFIIGKSGSGKSTLLNLLGGLDTITKGDIIADGNSLSSFDKKDFENYRSTYIGFVFQHYYLLDELTVRQNVELAMGIVGAKDKGQVDKLFKRVGLAGCEDRYPKELSGGQQQRVAIARALVKNPKLVLGDELTGNLDHDTSVEILKVLKEISRDRLVIVVSHNLDEADMFADRIIELQEGRVVRDRIRVNDKQSHFMVKGRVAYLPYFRDLNAEELKVLDRGLKSGRICDVVQQDDGFAVTTNLDSSNREIALKRRHFTRKNRNQYTGIFTKKGALSKMITVLFVTLILLCASVFASVDKIEHADMVYKTNQSYVALVKCGLENSGTGLFSSNFYRVTDSDIEKAESVSGERVYRLVNVTLITNTKGSSNTASGYQTDIKRNLNGYYVNETYGTLICDRSFLINEYGVNGELVVLAGNVNTTLASLAIITDYVADAMIALNDNYSNYNDIIKGYRATAVIYTGYKEKYADIIAAYDAYEIPSDYKEGEGNTPYDELYVKLCDNPLFEQFLREVIYSLGISYTFNQNYINECLNPSVDIPDIEIPEEYKEIYESLNAFKIKSATIRNTTFEKDGVVYPIDSVTRISASANTTSSNTTTNSTNEYLPISEGEIKMGFTSYNSIFGTAYTSENYKTFTPHTVTIRVYDRNVEGGELLLEKTYTIVCLVSGSGMRVTKSEFELLKPFHYQVFGLYVKNNASISNTASVMAERSMSARSIAFEAVAGINKTMGVFVPLFKLIAVGLYIFVVVYLINFAIQTIKRNYFQIGVFRSFGAKNADVGVIFITGVLVIGMLISVLSIAFAPLMIDVYDKILVESFALTLNTKPFDINVVDLSWGLLAINAVLVLAVSAISSVIALLVIRNLKPIEIIRAKDNGGEV